MSTETKKRESLQDASPNQFIYDSERGMTLRDYFANSAMQTILKHNLERGLHTTTNINNYEATSLMSYTVADAMLKTREL